MVIQHVGYSGAHWLSSIRKKKGRGFLKKVFPPPVFTRPKVLFGKEEAAPVGNWFFQGTGQLVTVRVLSWLQFLNHCQFELPAEIFGFLLIELKG